MRKTWKMRVAALLLTAVCTVGASFAAYADDVPSGPASDMELIQRREQASGSQNEAGDAQTAAGSENHAGAAEGQQTTENQETGNNGQTASETQGTEQGDSQVPDGMVASGGRYIDPNAPMVALTFDDGPYAPVGNRIMDCAEQYGGRVTFYVVGNRVNSYKSEIQRMYANGHEIGNHTPGSQVSPEVRRTGDSSAGGGLQSGGCRDHRRGTENSPSSGRWKKQHCACQYQPADRTLECGYAGLEDAQCGFIGADRVKPGKRWLGGSDA